MGWDGVKSNPLAILSALIHKGRVKSKRRDMKQRIARFIDIWAEKAMDGGSRALCGPSEFEAMANARWSETNTYLSGRVYSSDHRRASHHSTRVLPPNVAEDRDSGRDASR